mmetsp:Transcript_5724/g.7502  ORF Transcript_5724/g.7502 Transcript_5724/m.7502 type:complete len:81 (-) Transcript_5724:115-357(-)
MSMKHRDKNKAQTKREKPALTVNNHVKKLLAIQVTVHQPRGLTLLISVLSSNICFFERLSKELVKLAITVAVVLDKFSSY